MTNKIIKAISVRQPWAWLIVMGFKDIENRTWNTNFRGTVLIHAAKQRDDCYGWSIARQIFKSFSFEERKGFPFPDSDHPIWKFGGIIGKADIVDCVTESKSRWFFGLHGFVLENQKELPFIPCKGSLSLWNVPEDVLKQLEMKGEILDEGN